jgi:hypothetical protein
VEREAVARKKKVVLSRLDHSRRSKRRIPASEIEGVIAGREWRKHKFKKPCPAFIRTLAAVEFKTPFPDIYEEKYI